MASSEESVRKLRFRWSRLRRRYGDGAAAIDEAIVGAAPWRWRTGRLNRRDDEMDDGSLMTHKYRGSIVVLSISKSVEPNEEQKEMISGFQQGILCKY